MPNPVLGVVLHGAGGFAAGSFYVPLKRVRRWAWECAWLTMGVFAWLAAPWIVSLLTVPDTLGILARAPAGSFFWAAAFGAMWGLGNLTFGLTMRYLGMSLGMAVALGFCATFGTLIPPIFEGKAGALIHTTSGLVTLLGVVVCVVGIAVCGLAGMRKERELPDADKKAAIAEFNFRRGIWVAVFSGIMSAGFAFGLTAGKPIADIAGERGAPPMWVNNPVLIAVLCGGFVTNVLWCLYLNVANRSFGDYVKFRGSPWPANVSWCALGGITWYGQFFFYGMGTTQLGRDLDFASWTLHMAFIIIFSNLWGIILREWKGTSPGTHVLILAGILTLIGSTVIVGYGTYLNRQEKAVVAGSPAETDRPGSAGSAESPADRHLPGWAARSGDLSMNSLPARSLRGYRPMMLYPAST